MINPQSMKWFALLGILLFLGVAVTPSINADEKAVINSMITIGNNDLPDFRILGFETKYKHYVYPYGDYYSVFCNITNRGADYNGEYNVNFLLTPFFLPMIPLWARNTFTGDLNHGEFDLIELFTFREGIRRLFWFHAKVYGDGGDANPLDNKIHRPFMIIGTNIFPKTVRL